ncbi:MAG: DNA polymerase III subunit beta [Xanthomonadales bacterium]|nr:DNA polymerase III subunit beta [Xanthomonadales bacterium]
MKFSIQREAILQPLSQVVGVVERRQTLPVLANFLIVAKEDQISVTGTDMEVELVATASAIVSEAGETTVPARKLVDICRALPDGVEISFEQEGERVLVKAGRSRFTLSTLPASEFPTIEAIESMQTVQVEEKGLKQILDKTAFAMANGDVRYYLNGLLFDLSSSRLRTVATDGHRLALSDLNTQLNLDADLKLIVPRKGVLELIRMLSDSDQSVELSLSEKFVRLVRGEVMFTSKLIDGRFPEYQAVIPVGAEKSFRTDRAEMIRALQRVSILSNEKYHGVRLELFDNNMKIVAHNRDQEEAVENLAIEQDMENTQLGFNVTYLLDALNALDSEMVVMSMQDPSSSCLVTEPDNDNIRHVVMPLKL